MNRHLPITVLIVTILGLSAFEVLYVIRGIRASQTTEMAMTLATQLAFVFWMTSDAEHRRRLPCYDFGLFALLMFPLSLLWYAFRSRGWRGFLLLGGLFALMLAPSIAGEAARLLRYDLRYLHPAIELLEGRVPQS